VIAVSSAGQARARPAHLFENAVVELGEQFGVAGVVERTSMKVIPLSFSDSFTAASNVGEHRFDRLERRYDSSLHPASIE